MSRFLRVSAARRMWLFPWRVCGRPATTRIAAVLKWPGQGGRSSLHAAKNPRRWSGLCTVSVPFNLLCKHAPPPPLHSTPPAHFRCWVIPTCCPLIGIYEVLRSLIYYTRARAQRHHSIDHLEDRDMLDDLPWKAGRGHHQWDQQCTGFKGTTGGSAGLRDRAERI